MEKNRQIALRLLKNWSGWAGNELSALPGRPDLRFYGSGYIHWGVQSNWNFAGSMATLSMLAPKPLAEEARQMALSSMRTGLATHTSGKLVGADGKSWGHSWIGILGLERCLNGLSHLQPFLETQDEETLQRVLVDEADWIFHHAGRGEHRGVVAGLWASSGKNVPESNIWLGAFLWRVAQMYPDQKERANWMERAHDYLVNGISIPSDSENTELAGGKPICNRHVGANYFSNFALDHHGYCNVGYMAICSSNAAILHFDCLRENWERPDSLDHHQKEHWRVLRRMVSTDGRLLRIGGDSRVRYAYCQEYLLPSLLYAAHHLGDSNALALAGKQLELMEREAASNSDGSFYGPRLRWLRQTNPHYFCRLESDRAIALSMFLNYSSLITGETSDESDPDYTSGGEWSDSEHGAVLSRSPSRFASVSWRACTPGQALCLPPQASNLAEWSRNLAPVVGFLGDLDPHGPRHRKLFRCSVNTIPGGFITSGTIQEGMDTFVDEGAQCSDQALTHLAFAALPDEHTFLVLQQVQAAEDRLGYINELKGLHLNLPNDLFNKYRREIYFEGGCNTVEGPCEKDEVMVFPGKWLNLDGILGVVRLDGDSGFFLDRSATNRGGRYRSLQVDEICTTVKKGLFRPAPGERLLDVACAVLSDVSPDQVRSFEGSRLVLSQPDASGVKVRGLDGKTYSFAANFGSEPVEVETIPSSRELLAPGEARLW